MDNHQLFECYHRLHQAHPGRESQHLCPMGTSNPRVQGGDEVGSGDVDEAPRRYGQQQSQGSLGIVAQQQGDGDSGQYG